MSEFMSSAELAWEAAHAANYTFDEMQRAETEAARNVLAAEFSTLRAMAGIALAPPLDVGKVTDVQQVREAVFREQIVTPIGVLVHNLKKDGFEPPHKPALHQHVFNILDRETAPTLRDVLVIGRAGVGSMRNLGEKGMDFLQKTIEAVDPRLEWLERPMASYVAMLCSGPEQVPARAISSHFDGFFTARTGIGTLADLLELNVVTLTGILQKRHLHTEKTDSEIALLAQQLYKEAGNYARALEGAIQARARSA